MKIRIPKIPFMRYSTQGLYFSAILTVLALCLIFWRGFNFGLEFTGGATLEVRFDNTVQISEIREEISVINPHASVIQYGSSRDIQISFGEVVGEDIDVMMADMFQVIKAKHPDAQLVSQSKIGAQYRAELVEKGLVALLLSCLGMVIYLSFRFEWKFAVSAVVGQLHDVIITASLFALMQWTFDLNVLAALLAVLGYSVNDTVVLYDRIRENMIKMPATDVEEIINLSIQQTMMRTIVTSLTTLLSVIALLFFGGETLFGFAITMVVGIIFGTYSSIFVATSMVNKLNIKHEDLLPKTREAVDDLP